MILVVVVWLLFGFLGARLFQRFILYVMNKPRYVKYLGEYKLSLGDYAFMILLVFLGPIGIIGVWINYLLEI